MENNKLSSFLDKVRQNWSKIRVSFKKTPGSSYELHADYDNMSATVKKEPDKDIVLEFDLNPSDPEPPN